jgi:hypothetical protein
MIWLMFTPAALGYLGSLLAVSGLLDGRFSWWRQALFGVSLTVCCVPLVWVAVTL